VRFRNLLIALLPGFLVAGALWTSNQPTNFKASASVEPAHVTGALLFTHPYKPPEQIDCGPTTPIPQRLLSEVVVQATGPVHAPIVFEFGSVGTGRNGSDQYAWIQETRDVLIPAGTSQNPLVDQAFAALPPGIYYFEVRVGGVAGDVFKDRCEFFWPG
jgi:hypothetical protein